MLQSSADAERHLREGRTLFGEGWKFVSSFDEMDADEEAGYESEEEEIYVTMDLGSTIDSKALQTENQYQLVGLDTPLPFLKIGNQIFQGEVTPLIGDEVILDLVRNHDNPQTPSHPPIASTNHRLTFRAVKLEQRVHPVPQAEPPASVTSASASVPQTGVSAVKGDGDGFASPGPTGTATSVTEQGPGATTENVGPVPADADADGRAAPPIAGPSASPLISHPFFAPATATGSEAPGRTRGVPRVPRMSRGKGRRVVLDDPDELVKLDLDRFKPGLSFELGSKVLEFLGLPSAHGEGIALTRKELEKVLSGLPGASSGSGSGSGSGKSKGGRRRKSEVGREENDVPAAGSGIGAGGDTEQDGRAGDGLGDTVRGDAATGQSGSTNVPSTSKSGRTKLDEDITMRDARDAEQVQDEDEDPPWQVVGADE